MRRAANAVLAVILSATASNSIMLRAQSSEPAAGAPMTMSSQAWTFERDGWTYVHLEGTPKEIGYQHGYMLKDAIEDNLHVYEVENAHELSKSWSYFREAGRTVLWPHVSEEYRAELQGIADGMKAAGSTRDLWDIVALNGNLELTDYYLPMMNARAGAPTPPKAVAPGKCSAFIATGKATRDGKVVVAHSNWSSYAEGERWTTVFDIVPRAGQRILMDGTPGVITSQDDFGVNAAGLMITETTLPMAKGFDPDGVPEFVRSRKAMQYATSIDEYVAILREGNNGGYANSWLVGDRKTGEIAYLELGLKHTPLLRKKGRLLRFVELRLQPGSDPRRHAGLQPEEPFELDERTTPQGGGVHPAADGQNRRDGGRGVSFRPRGRL